MTKYVISGYIGFDNFGDEAIAGVLTKHLKEINAEKITVISGNPCKTSELFEVDSVKFLNFIPAILKSDILISGGGSLLQDRTSLKSLLYYLAVISTAIIFNKKVFIFAQGFTPFRTKIGKILTKIFLKRCNRISVRDSFSQKLLKEMGIESELVCDPIFGIEVPQNIEHEGVGVQLRGFETITAEFLECLADEISKKFPNETIKLFSLQDSIDMPVLTKFSNILAKKGITTRIYKNMPVFETVKELSNLKYLIGMRFHACLTAAKARVKVLGINYDIKVKTLSEEIGFPIINLSRATINEGFERLLCSTSENYKLPEFYFPNLKV